MPRAFIAYEHWEREQAGEPEKLLVNMFGEAERTNPKRDRRLVTSPGTRDRDIGNVISGTIRALAQSDAFADGKILILNNTTLRTWSPSTGTFGTISGTVSGTDRADVTFTQTEMALLSGGDLYVSNGTTVTVATDPDFPSVITSVASMAQRILLTAEDGKFWYTDVLDVGSIDALSFYTAEASPDNLVAVRVYAEMALLFGSETIEMWYAEPSNPDDPFSRSSSVIPVGCLCRDSIAITDRGPVWVAPDLTVRTLSGADAPVISPPWVTRMLFGVTVSDIMGAWYSAEGSMFYCLNTPNFCAVLDMMTAEWHLRETTEVKEAIVSVTLSAPALNASGKVLLQGMLNASFEEPTITAAGLLVIQSFLDQLLSAPTLESEIILTPDISADLSVTLDAPALSSDGVLPITGVLDVVLVNVSLSSEATIAASYDTDAQAFFDACDTEPSAGAKAAINDLVVGLKDDAIWDELDAFWPMCLEDSQAGRLNLKSPGNFTLTAVNSPTFTAKFGWAGDGSTSYLNTGWDAANNGSNFAQNDASLGCWIDAGTDTGGGVSAMGGRSTASNGTRLRPWVSPSGVIGSINGPLSSFGSVSTRYGLTALERTGASACAAYRDGSLLSTDNDASNSPSNTDIYICGVNAGGTPSELMDNRISCAFVAGSLGSTKQGDLYDRLNTFRTAMAAL